MSPTTLLSIQLSANTSWEAAGDGKLVGPCHLSGRPRQAPGSCLRPGPDLALVGILGVNQQMQATALTLSIPTPALHVDEN